MTSFWPVVLGVLGGVLLLWAGLVLSLWLEQRRHSNSASLRDLVRLVPVVALALRLATRHAGMAAVSRHWPGTAEGLAAVLRLAGLHEPG
jgi:hypothetical protein